MNFLSFNVFPVVNINLNISDGLSCAAFFPQLAQMNIEAQRVERELRDELVSSISKAVSDADRARIAELEKNEAELRSEASKYY